VLDETLTYEVDMIRIVEPHETDDLLIQEGKDLSTLVTCTPYGINSHRLLVRGVRVDGTDLSAREDGVINEITDVDMKYLITFSFIGLCIIFFAYIKLHSIRKKKKQTANTEESENNETLNEDESANEDGEQTDENNS